MHHTFSRAFRIALAAILTTSFIATTTSPTAPVALADGPQTWWVATSGTAASPANTGSSCANPSFVGATHSAIQSAIDAASSGDDIRICSGTYAIGTTISVGTDLTFTGEGTSLPILDGGNATRIMNIASGGISVSINKLQFQNGRVSGDGIRGGAIMQHPNANLTVNDSMFLNNRAVDDHGGAISMIGSGDGSNTGSLTVARSTFYRNYGLDGGAIVIVGNSTPSTIVNSTFVENKAQRNGGAVNGSFADLSASNSTFIDNTAPDGGDNSWVVKITNSIIAYSPNVSHSSSVCYFRDGDNPVGNVSDDASCLVSGTQPVTYNSLKLGIVAPWGGPTPTVPIGAGSSAIDVVDSAACPANDQRGESRSGSTCDAGAFEFKAGTGSISTTSTITLIKGRAVNPAPVFTQSGLTNPVAFRIASELTIPLPGGTSFSSTTGSITGTPNTTYLGDAITVTATDATGTVVSARLPVVNCILGKDGETYLISSASDLGVFEAGACGLGSTYRQTADIAWNGAWDEVSTESSPFTGTYDGDGHSLTGLQISGGQKGFFTYTKDATIKDVDFGVTLSDSYASGGLIRLSNNTEIVGVHLSGTVAHPNGDVDPGCLGGLVGEADNSTTISDSSFEGEVNGRDGNWVGGLIGCSYSGVVVERSYFDGTVKGNANVGALVGWMEKTEVRDSYAVGSVKASGWEIGGLVGSLDQDGSDSDTIAIMNSYASVSIEGSTSIGALVGIGESTSLSSSFWQAGLSGIEGLAPIGKLRNSDGTQPSLTPTAETSMKSRAFFDGAGWAIVDGWADMASSQKIWGICDGQARPFLLWQHSASPCTQPQPPTSTTVPSTSTTVPTPTVTTVPGTVNNPVVSPGVVAVFVGGEQVIASIDWSNPSRVSGTIGDIKLAMVFNTGASGSGSAGSITSGASFTLAVGGLKPGSQTTATIFSKPVTLGKIKVTSKGKLKAPIRIPKTLSPGKHRLRLQMFDKKGHKITVWFGIRVKAAPKAKTVTRKNSVHRTSCAPLC